MRCPRLLLESEALAAGRSLPAPQDRLHYATTVLRLKSGAPCRVFDGLGNEFEATLELNGRRDGTFHLGERAAPPTHPAFPIHLLQGIARGDHMDLAIQKAVELGVQSIRPVLCERSRSAAAHKGLDKRQRHWHGILRAAAEQCGRNELPQLQEPAPPDTVLSGWHDTLALLAEEGAPGLDARLDGRSRPAAVALFVGPEGGLTPAEIALAQDRGFLGVGMGPRTLRTETAAMALLTLVQARLGDLQG
ncbi:MULTISPECIES: 16S rRNA (uracil(1498)-N(3))-methyltransferase [unclassified Thioalkalivibrio]|uniref:16S rRNA (uracil(1498)-N(3))-methyltransferase n=1 Tax=unclassified Thioalkalivibrio TaxID=2621013 RepID=UPI00036036A8|nr:MULTISPECIES: 16S rRNA (uracil(1498)-N(3))-methyltransferase [unclassified Thioalkalivibrio]